MVIEYLSHGRILIMAEYLSCVCKELGWIWGFGAGDTDGLMWVDVNRSLDSNASHGKEEALGELLVLLGVSLEEFVHKETLSYQR